MTVVFKHRLCWIQTEITDHHENLHTSRVTVFVCNLLTREETWKVSLINLSFTFHSRITSFYWMRPQDGWSHCLHSSIPEWNFTSHFPLNIAVIPTIPLVCRHKCYLITFFNIILIFTNNKNSSSCHTRHGTGNCLMLIYFLAFCVILCCFESLICCCFCCSLLLCQANDSFK